MKKIVRWSFRKKMRVVLQVKSGDLTEAQACKEYDLSLEELRDWIDKVKKYGPMSLKVTNVQMFRSVPCAQ